MLLLDVYDPSTGALVSSAARFFPTTASSYWKRSWQSSAFQALQFTGKPWESGGLEETLVPWSRVCVWAPTAATRREAGLAGATRQELVMKPLCRRPQNDEH